MAARGKVIQLRRGQGRLTSIELRGISQAWREGYTYEEIAREASRTIKVIKKAIHRDLGYAEPRFTEEDYAAMRYAYEDQYHTCYEIAEMFDFPKGSASWVLYKAGVRMRRHGWKKEQERVRVRASA